MTNAIGTNSEGDVVGAYAPAFSVAGSHGFLLSNGRLTTVDFPGAVAGFAYGINPEGAIVGIIRRYGWRGPWLPAERGARRRRRRAGGAQRTFRSAAFPWVCDEPRT